MVSIKIKNKKKKSYKGFTLIEVIVIISILSILLLIAVPNYKKYIEDAKNTVCNSNCLTLERMYGIYLETKSQQHSDALFQDFLTQNIVNINLNGHSLDYLDGKVRCSIHVRDEIKESNDDEIPYL